MSKPQLPIPPEACKEILEMRDLFDRDRDAFRTSKEYMTRAKAIATYIIDSEYTEALNKLFDRTEA